MNRDSDLAAEAEGEEQGQERAKKVPELSVRAPQKSASVLRKPWATVGCKHGGIRVRGVLQPRRSSLGRRNSSETGPFLKGQEALGSLSPPAFLSAGRSSPHPVSLKQANRRGAEGQNSRGTGYGGKAG